MTPFIFGTTGLRIFGIHSPPRESDRRLGLVMCYPFGGEYYAAYNACRSLADRIAGGGVHVLRFDYPGTGDSAGEPEDFTAESLIESVDQAVDELRQIAEVDRVYLLGLRLGALMALAAAVRRPDISGVVLWDPPDSIVANMDCPHDLPSRLPALAEARRVEQALIVSCARHAPCAADSALPIEHRPGPEVWRTDREWGSVGLPVEAFEAMATWVAT